jgi:hypothetical protein
LFCRCLEGRTAARLWPLDSPSRMGSAKRRERGREGGKEGEIIVCASVLCSGFYDLVQFSSVQFSTVHYGTVQFSTVQYSTVQFSSVQFSSVQFSSDSVTFTDFFKCTWSHFLSQSSSFFATSLLPMTSSNLRRSKRGAMAQKGIQRVGSVSGQECVTVGVASVE